jgi:hypothetical protein
MQEERRQAGLTRRGDDANRWSYDTHARMVPAVDVDGTAGISF